MNMKKLICRLVLLVSAVCLLSAIAAKAEEQQAAPMKNLVVYYSYTGNTELVGKTLAGILKADVIGIEDVTKPTREQAFGAGKEASLQGKSWPIKPFNKDLSSYSRIFVGCPVWFGMPTPEFNAFVEQVSFTGKQVVVFVTLGGGSQEKAIKTMTEKVTAKGGKVVSSFFVRTKNVTRDDIAAKAREIAKQY
jgi:flavodoxin